MATDPMNVFMFLFSAGGQFSFDSEIFTQSRPLRRRRTDSRGKGQNYIVQFDKAKHKVKNVTFMGTYYSFWSKDE